MKLVPLISVFLIASCVQSATIDEKLPEVLVSSEKQTRPEVLILGDSQISFGAGATYSDFFNNLERNCNAHLAEGTSVQKLQSSHTTALGVRSTSLQSWVKTSGPAKDTICKVDAKFGVNAGVYGAGGNPNRKFIQVGKEPGFQYCQSGRSVFENIFVGAGEKPDLLVLNFLGNAAQRWANSQDVANADVALAFQQIPKDVPCVVLTTAPVFSKSTNDLRQTAQLRLERAMKAQGEQCRLVKGFTPQTRNAIEGKKQFFRQNDQGKIIDPLHPNGKATGIFTDLIAPEFCRAIGTVLR